MTASRRRAYERTETYRALGSEGRRLATAGRYELRQRLGLGGMGAVYEAWDPELARRVAVKLMRPRSARDATEAQARLRREAQSMAALHHPNVLGVYDVGLTQSGVFLAMPLVEGPDAACWLREQQPHWRKIIEVFVAAGRGLAAAHAAGIVHRDFKPTNILIDRNGGVFVCDFGIAAFVEGERQLEPLPLGLDAVPKPARLTRKGTAMGTPAYMAPEQHEGRAVDARSDQFSFCVALYEALFGTLPFTGMSPREIWQAKKGSPPPPPVGSGVPRRVLTVLERGLSWRPEERYPSMDELLLDLRSVIRRRHWQRVMMGLTAGGLAVLGLTAGAATSSPEIVIDQPAAMCGALAPQLPSECAEVDEALRGFGRARRLARDPAARAEGIALARSIRRDLAASQCPSATELHAEITGWLDAVQDFGAPAQAARPGS